MIVLERRQLAGRSPYPDPIDDMIDEVLGFVALFMGGVTFHAFRRAGPGLTLS